MWNCPIGTFSHVSTVSLTPLFKSTLSHWHLPLCDTHTCMHTCCTCKHPHSSKPMKLSETPSGVGGSNNLLPVGRTVKQYKYPAAPLVGIFDYVILSVALDNIVPTELQLSLRRPYDLCVSLLDFLLLYHGASIQFSNT